MNKNKKIILISKIIMLISLILIICGIGYSIIVPSRETEAISQSFKYKCVYTKKHNYFTTIFTYIATVNPDNNITYLVGTKQYVSDNETDYYNTLYSVSTRNVDYTTDYDTFTTTIHMHDGPILNDSLEEIYPNYLEYMNSIIDDTYTCEFIN